MTQIQTTNQMIREFQRVLTGAAEIVKIRYRPVRNGGEYQVVLGRKVIFRADLQAQAEKWARENGYAIAA